jgi:hypothetical protein
MEEVMNTKKTISKLSTVAQVFTTAAVTALLLCAAPIANAGDKGCSTATLRGIYADKDTGFIVGVGQFAGVNLETFDGKGTLTGTGFSSVNGYVAQGTFAGTYQVNPDCTGTYSVQDPQGDTFHAFFVIDDGGNELQIVITDPGTVITCLARRQSPVGGS